MNVVIIEDEPLAANQLRDTIFECCGESFFYPVIDSVEDAVKFFSTRPALDLVFMDIQLSDGQAFEVFETVEVEWPIIFTTAYDHYAIRAFEVNSIDYLLKPISKPRVQKAISKYQKQNEAVAPFKFAGIGQLQKLFSVTQLFRENFLVSFKEKLIPVPVDDFAWFEIKNAVVIGTRFDKTPVVLEERSLDELATMVDPRKFYRANRQYLINRRAVKEIAHYFNGKLLATMHPSPAQAVVVSREKASAFKQWMQ